MLLLAQDSFGLSLAGQVFMGTAFVLHEQAVKEALLVFVHGNVDHYRVLVFWQFLATVVPPLYTGAPSLAAYEHIGQTSAFYAVAALGSAYALAFTGYFMRRLRRAPSGLCGGLAAAEASSEPNFPASK